MAAEDPDRPLTAAELAEIAEYEKIIAFHNDVVSRTHLRVKLRAELIQKHGLPQLIDRKYTHEPTATCLGGPPQLISSNMSRPSTSRPSQPLPYLIPGSKYYSGTRGLVTTKPPSPQIPPHFLPAQTPVSPSTQPHKPSQTFIPTGPRQTNTKMAQFRHIPVHIGRVSKPTIQRAAVVQNRTVASTSQESLAIIPTPPKPGFTKASQLPQSSMPTITNGYSQNKDLTLASYNRNYYADLRLPSDSTKTAIRSSMPALPEVSGLKQEAYNILPDDYLSHKYDEGRVVCSKQTITNNSHRSQRSSEGIPSGPRLANTTTSQQPQISIPTGPKRSTTHVIQAFHANRTSVIDYRRDYYQDLGVSPYAGRTAIHNAMRTLRAQDRYSGTEKEAYDILSADNLRRIYDDARAFSSKVKDVQVPKSMVEPKATAGEKIQIDFTRDYYRVLAVQCQSSVTTSSINKAFSHLRRIFGPSSPSFRNPAGDVDARAREKWARIQEAHAVLSDTQLRKEYDAGCQVARIKRANRCGTSSEGKKEKTGRE